MNIAAGEIVKDVGAIDWNVLWSGAIGSLVAAIVGGGVALLVVLMTKRHESRLASEGREKVALADLEAAVTRVGMDYQGGHAAVQPRLQEIISAIARWRMESTYKDLIVATKDWPADIVTLAVAASDEERTGSMESAEKLYEVVVRIQLLCSNWHREPGMRGMQMLQLKEQFASKKLNSSPQIEDTPKATPVEPRQDDPS